MSVRIDCLQYANWSEQVFLQMRDGDMQGVHVTIAYHENFIETIANIKTWNQYFRRWPELIFLGQSGEDIKRAKTEQKTAIFFGFQNPSPLEGDIGLLEIWKTLGVSFIQLSYNDQSLFATGYKEANDTGLTRLGRQAILEMNRLGIVVDMSHSNERSTLEAISTSTRPVAITHANPDWWHAIARNKSDAVLQALSDSGGMLGLSLYPLHLLGGSNCTLVSFTDMLKSVVDRYGLNFVGWGTDLCQNQPDTVLQWMRNGRWGESDANDMNATFPSQPSWFKDNRHFNILATSLADAGFKSDEVNAIMGENWHRFYQNSLKTL